LAEERGAEIGHPWWRLQEELEMSELAMQGTVDGDKVLEGTIVSSPVTSA